MKRVPVVLPQRSVYKWDITCVLIMRKGVCVHINCTSSSLSQYSVSGYI